MINKNKFVEPIATLFISICFAIAAYIGKSTYYGRKEILSHNSRIIAAAISLALAVWSGIEFYRYWKDKTK